MYCDAERFLRTSRTTREVPAGTASGQDALVGLREVRPLTAASPSPVWCTGDLRLPRADAYLRPHAGREVRPASAHDTQTPDGQARRGRRRTTPSPSRPDPSTRSVAGLGVARAPCLLRRAEQHQSARYFPNGCHTALVPLASAAEPASSAELEAHGLLGHSLAPPCPHRSSLAWSPL